MTKPVRYRAYDQDGNVVHTGDCRADGSCSFKAPADVARVVLYAGDPEAEFVVGVFPAGALKGEAFSLTVE